MLKGMGVRLVKERKFLEYCVGNLCCDLFCRINKILFIILFFLFVVEE